MLRHVARVTPGFFAGNPAAVGAPLGGGPDRRGASRTSSRRGGARSSFVSALSPSAAWIARLFQGRCYTVGLSHGHCDSMSGLRYEEERLSSGGGEDGRARSSASSSTSASSSSSLFPASYTPSLAATALCWVQCAPVGPSSEILCVGYTDGSVRAYAPQDGGKILFSERYHDKSPVVKIKLQATSAFKHAPASSSSHSPRASSFSELWILHEDGTLVVLHLSQLRRAMQSAFNGTKPAEGCPHFKWQLQRQFAFVDFAAASSARPDLFHPKARPAGVNVLVCGTQPFCCVFRADGDTSEVPVTLKDAVSELVGWAGTAVLSSAAAFAPSWLSRTIGGGGGGDDTTTATNSWDSSSYSQYGHETGGLSEDDGSVWNDLAKQKSARSLKRYRPLRDDPRQILSCALAPTIVGIPRVAALSDNLGRVMLVDVDDATVIRVFKGYRDAQCGWMTMNASGVAGCYLVVYAPNRGRIKVWRAVHGPLICSIKVPDTKSYADARLHMTVSRNTQDAHHLKARCFLISVEASGDQPTRASPDPHYAMYEVVLPESRASRVLEEHYLVAENQEDGYVLAGFVEALKGSVASTRLARTGSNAHRSGEDRKKCGGKYTHSDRRVHGEKRDPSASLLDLLDKIATPEVLVLASEAINDLLIGQGSETQGRPVPSVTLTNILLSRIFSRLYAALPQKIASAKETTTALSERVRRLRASLRMMGTQTGLFSTYLELELLSARKPSFTDSVFGANDRYSDGGESDNDPFATYGDDAKEASEPSSLMASHLKAWMGLWVPEEVHEAPSGASVRVSLSFFCRCMRASFRVLELARSTSTFVSPDHERSATPNHERFATEIDTLELSPFGVRPHRKRLLSRFIFQPLLQHVFSMGGSLIGSDDAHGFRRVHMLLLGKMRAAEVMSLFATFWFDKATTSEMLSPEALARSGSVAGPPTSSAAARWLFECSLRKEFYDPSCEGSGGTSAFRVLMQSCTESSDFFKALLLARMCSQVWAQPVLQSDIVYASSSQPMPSHFATVGDSPGEEQSNETDDDDCDADEWTTPPPSEVSDGRGGGDLDDDDVAEERSSGIITNLRRREHEAWTQVVRRLELALYLNCALGRRFHGNQGSPITLDALMSGDPMFSTARLVAEHQLLCGHDTEETSLIESLRARMAQARRQTRDMHAIRVLATAAFKNTTYDVGSDNVDQACAESTRTKLGGEALIEKIRRGEVLSTELQWQDGGWQDGGGGGGGRISDAEPKQTLKDAGSGNDGRLVDHVAWKWFGEVDGASLAGGAIGYAPSSLQALVVETMTESEGREERDHCFAALNSIACIFPQVAYDFDCVAAHRCLLLVERCTADAGDHMRDVQHAIASVSHAMTIRDSEDRQELGENVGDDSDGARRRCPSISLRTMVLLHIWTNVLCPLCNTVASLWATSEQEAASSFREITGDGTLSSHGLRNSESDNTVEAAWNKEIEFRTRRLHCNFLAKVALVLKLFLGIVEKRGESDTGDGPTKVASKQQGNDVAMGSWPLVENPLRAHMLASFSNYPPVSRTSVEAHLQAVSALLTIVRHSVWGWDAKRLFAGGENLFETGAVFDRTGTSFFSSSVGKTVSTVSLMAARLQLVAEVVVATGVDEAMALSTKLSCDRKAALTECMRMLLLTGRESTAIDILTKMEDELQKRIAGTLVAVVCEQVVTVLSAMRKDRRYRSLLSTVPADLFKSVKVAAKSARVARAALHISDPNGLTRASPSLSANHSLLGSLAPLLPRGSPELQTCIEVAGVVGTLYKGAKAIQAKGQVQGPAGRRR